VRNHRRPIPAKLLDYNPRLSRNWRDCLDEVPKVPLVVNAVYPKEQPLSTMPASMLEALPTLPDGLEYRFVGKHLILRDTKANIIVDFIYNAVP
jgi:hypothetical protein